MNDQDKINYLVDKRGYKFNPRSNLDCLTKRTNTGWREVGLDNLDIVYELDKHHRRTGVRLHVQW
jgi:hypothetical protein